MKYARLNTNNDILEIRDFDPEHLPVDIAHKEVRWRPLITFQAGDYDPSVQELNVSYVVDEEGQVIETLTPVGKNIEDLRQEILENLRKDFHMRILDAMPNMELVKSVCVTRDMAYNRVMQQRDYRVLLDMKNA